MTTAIRFWENQVLFRDNAVAMEDACCCEEQGPCLQCDGPTPTSFDVTLSGFSDGDCRATFPDGKTINTTWNLPVIVPLYSCVWNNHDDEDFSFCEGDCLALSIPSDPGNKFQLILISGELCTSPEDYYHVKYYWEAEQDPQGDCAVTNFELSYVGQICYWNSYSQPPCSKSGVEVGPCPINPWNFDGSSAYITARYD